MERFSGGEVRALTTTTSAHARDRAWGRREGNFFFQLPAFAALPAHCLESQVRSVLRTSMFWGKILRLLLWNSDPGQGCQAKWREEKNLENWEVGVAVTSSPRLQLGVRGGAWVQV